MKKAGLIIIVLGVIIAVAPIVSLILSMVIAGAAGCELNEAGAHPCVIMGWDAGSLIVTMFVSGWLAMLSLPIGAGVLLIGLLLMAFGDRRRDRSGGS